MIGITKNMIAFLVRAFFGVSGKKVDRREASFPDVDVVGIATASHDVRCRFCWLPLNVATGVGRKATCQGGGGRRHPEA